MSSIRLLKAGRFRSLVFFSPTARRTFPTCRPPEATGHKWHKGVWRGFDMTDLDSAGVAAVMNADDEDNGKALKSLGLAK